MRVTAETKQATDKAIRVAARQLFAHKGVGGTSTRDIAAAAQIAVGTMFNYFPSKEALAVALLWEALDTGRRPLAGPGSASGSATLEEELFAMVARDIRSLESMRPFVGEVFEAGLSPLSHSGISTESSLIRTGLLEGVGSALARHGLSDRATPGALHLFWSLYLGVMSFWSSDVSPAQEDSWALLDQSSRMFAGSMGARPSATTPARGETSAADTTTGATP